MNNKKRKFLLLYLKTGGGHLAPAKSVSSQLLNNHENIEPILLDGFEKAPGILKAIIEGGYRRLQYKAKWVYELLYAIYKIKFVAHLNAWFISIFVKKDLAEIIKREKPERIIIFHFFLIHPVYAALSQIKENVKIFTVVTDPFTAHPLWFLNKNQNFIVFSNQLKNHCMQIGISESLINVFHFILDEKFSRVLPEEEKNKLKVKYAIPQDRNVLLILGGGDGIPRGRKILKLLLNDYSEADIILISGNNKSMYDKAVKMKESGNHNHLHIYGYVNFVYDLINISDVVITKCGASTFMEILISKKIPVITAYIWEQEKGNKDYVVQNGMGVYVKKLDSLPDIIRTVFRNRNFYKMNIEKAKIRNGAADVAAYISS